MRLAVIPARGGSKRIPRKNIKSFAGMPMISYALRSARAAGVFDHIVVSTDDEEIAAVAVAAGAEVPFARPANLADDHTPTVPVIAHAIRCCQELGWVPTQTCCIYPAVPLLQPRDLVDALAVLERHAASYVFPVAAFASPIQRALRLDASGRVAPFHPQYAGTRTQDLERGYFDAGQFYWGTTQAWLDGLNIHQHGAAIVIPEWRVADIDTPEDWERAELLYHSVATVQSA